MRNISYFSHIPHLRGFADSTSLVNTCQCLFEKLIRFRSRGFYERLFQGKCSMSHTSTQPDSKHSHVPVQKNRSLANVPVLKLNKIAVIGKTTRYEFERRRYPGCTEEQFKEIVDRRGGSSYQVLYTRHKKHLEMLDNILNVLINRNIEYRVCNRGHAEWDADTVEWADVILTAGGDGTFLSAATKIKDRNKPLVGINTDPERSEGHLCLPSHYCQNFEDVLEKIKRKEFSWLFRTRIRITMSGPKSSFVPFENGQVLQKRMQQNDKDGGADDRPTNYLGADSSDDDSFTSSRPPRYHSHVSVSSTSTDRTSQVLPVLALNEVFIGELLAAVPTYYEIGVDGGGVEKQKSSGVCVSTGTGSTAWSRNICSLHQSQVRKLLDMVPIRNRDSDADYIRFVADVTQRFSDSYVFGAEEDSMFYSIRDPMQNKIYTCEKPHGFARQITLKSRCWDAALSIDGDTSFAFNDGCSVTLQLFPEDQLRTIQLRE